MPTLDDVERLIESKAARIGLTLANFELLMQLCNELEDHAGIQALAYQKPVLTLMSLEAEYRVSLANGMLECHIWECDTRIKSHKTRLVWTSDDSVQGFEGLREAILWEEGFEVSVVAEAITKEEILA